MVSPGATNVFKTDNHVMINCTLRQRWQRHAAPALLLPDPPPFTERRGTGACHCKICVVENFYVKNYFSQGVS